MKMADCPKCHDVSDYAHRIASYLYNTGRIPNNRTVHEVACVIDLHGAGELHEALHRLVIAFFRLRVQGFMRAPADSVDEMAMACRALEKAEQNHFDPPDDEDEKETR